MASEVNENQTPANATPWKQDFMNRFGFGKKGEVVETQPPPEPNRAIFQRVWDMYTPKKYEAPVEASRGLPGDFEQVFDRLLKQESGKRHRDKEGNMITSPKGAQGISQVMPKTGRDPGYGVAPLADDSESEYIRFGKDLFRAYTSAFNGDIRKGLAAYNAGPGRISKLIETHGNKWESALPAETKNYLKKILKD